MSPWIFVRVQTAKTAYGVGIYTVFTIQGERNAAAAMALLQVCLCKAFHLCAIAD